jgi:hypothetical protein
MVEQAEPAPLGVPVFNNGAAGERAEAEVGKCDEYATQDPLHGDPAKRRQAKGRPEHDDEQDYRRGCQVQEMREPPLARVPFPGTERSPPHGHLLQ